MRVSEVIIGKVSVLRRKRGVVEYWWEVKIEIKKCLVDLVTRRLLVIMEKSFGVKMGVGVILVWGYLFIDLVNM